MHDPTSDAPPASRSDLDAIVADTVDSIDSASDRSVPSLRSLRRGVSRTLRQLAASDVVYMAEQFLGHPEIVPRWFVYELVHHHPPAMKALDEKTLRRLGRGIRSWGEVDPFACYLTGVAWREGQLPDAVVHRWARSKDRWWRRVALVSSVPLNSKARGGSGDASRTLAVCDLLKADRDDMVVKAFSWALRELTKRDPVSVRTYVDQNRPDLAPRVAREVDDKLRTGVKNPKNPT